MHISLMINFHDKYVCIYYTYVYTYVCEYVMNTIICGVRHNGHLYN